ncbi:uncharacterized protein C5orf52 homolog isoform X2 [Hyla sarda]|uniref:uncharacterized protein C5orf52 homolog isoform X2 n=1 Tax=Hyla sarda TaxID=327740 RepID=UPI0024C33C74|nr:uncharacterized protein C5orf52 homolog isoform X2 [Hyla sarda]
MVQRCTERGLLPRSHLTDVITQNNMREKRMLELKLKQLSRTTSETLHFNEFLKEKFVSELHKKSDRWEKEHKAFMKYLHLDKKSRHSIALPSGKPQPLVVKKCYCHKPTKVTDRKCHHVKTADTTT